MLAGVSRRKQVAAISSRPTIVRRQSSNSSVRSTRKDDPLPRERAVLDFYSPLYPDPLWGVSVYDRDLTQCLLCDDSGGFDIETSPSATSNYVVGTASGRIWVYGKNKRVKFSQHTPPILGGPLLQAPLSPVDSSAIFNRLNTSQHEKRLLHDPSPSPGGCSLLAGSTSPSAKTSVSSTAVVSTRHEQRSIRRRWPTLTRSCAQNPRLHPDPPKEVPKDRGDLYYIGQVARGRRHGWGRLMSNQRTLYEGAWFEGGCHGFYLAYHEFYAEIGLQCSWFRVGVLVLRDNGNTIIPIALDRQPSTFKGDRSSDIVLQKSEYVNDYEPFCSTKRDDWWRSGEPPVFESAFSTKSFDFKSYSRAGTGILVPDNETYSMSQEATSDRDSSIVGSATRRGSGPAPYVSQVSDASQSVFLPRRPPPKDELHGAARRRSSLNPEDLQKRLWSVSESLTHKSSMTRCAAISRSLMCERKMVRRLSNPSDARVRINPASQVRIAEPNAKTMQDQECLTLWRHRRLMADFHRYGVVKASSLPRWTTEQLVMFLAAIGAYEAIGPFRQARVHGSQVQTFDHEILTEMGVSDLNCRRMLLSTFRYLWSGLDYSDPLAQRDLQKWHDPVTPLPDLNNHNINIRRRIGNGGHAMVYLGSIDPPINPPRGGGCVVSHPRAAMKIFTDTRKPRAVRVPSCNRPPNEKFATGSTSAPPSQMASSASSSRGGGLQVPLHPRSSESSKPTEITPIVLNLSSASEGPLTEEQHSFFGSDVWRGCGGTGGLMAMSMISFSSVISSIKDWLGPQSTDPARLASPPVRPALPAIKIDIIRGDEDDNTPPPPLLPECPYTEPPHRLGEGGSNKKTAALKMRDYEVTVMQCISRHPHVISALGHFQLPGELPGIAIEFCSQGALDNQVLYDQRSPLASGTRGKYSWTQLVQIFRQIAEGMAHVHESGFLHRDLKPSNFLIDDGHVGKVSDFGVSKSYKIGNPHPFFLAAYGNIYYAAPEVLRGEGSWPESDVYSFGVSFWEALTGKAVHEGLSRGHIFCRVATGRVTFPAPPLLSTGLSHLLSRMVAFDRRDRPSFRQIACYISQLDQANSVDALSSVQALMLG